MTWLIDNFANIAVLSMVLLLVYACIRSLISTRKSGLPSCGCGRNCATCALACMHGKQKNIRKYAEE
jgi:hypothetical protein